MGLTKSDAVMFAPQGIRINAICPGYVRTPLLQQAEVRNGSCVSNEVHLNGVQASGVMQGELAKVPFGRFAEMEEIADAIMFLASPLSSFMSGSGLVVDGGFTAGCY